MASHHQQSAEIIPFGPPGVRPIPVEHYARILDAPDLNVLLEQSYRREAEREFDTDCRIIGFGLLCGAVWVVVFRLAQLGWLS